MRRPARGSLVEHGELPSEGGRVGGAGLGRGGGEAVAEGLLVLLGQAGHLRHLAGGRNQIRANHRS
jgi:hypothetical protein